MRGVWKLVKYAPKLSHTLPLIKQKLINPKRATEQEKGIFFKLTFIIAYPVNFAFELLKRSVFFSPILLGLQCAERKKKRNKTKQNIEKRKDRHNYAISTLK